MRVSLLAAVDSSSLFAFRFVLLCCCLCVRLCVFRLLCFLIAVVKNTTTMVQYPSFSNKIQLT